MCHKNKISLIVPCYNEEESLPFFFNEIKRVSILLNNIEDIKCEFIFIDDGSKDNTLHILQEASQKDNRFHYISFSRNFGKEAAMYAGLQYATGDFVAIMDADMQDPPSLLQKMYEKLKNNEYDSVATRRVPRAGEPPIRSFFARCFYKIINKISDVDIVDGARDFRLMNRKMTDAILSLCERNRFSKGIFGWVGFRTFWLPYENQERAAGETKWNFWKLFQYAIDGIISFSHVPLRLASWLGILITFTSFVTFLFIIIRKIAFDDPVAGWASTMSTILFIGGIQLFCLGIMGQYISKIHIESKKRPHYIISSTDIKDNH